MMAHQQNIIALKRQKGYFLLGTNNGLYSFNGAVFNAYKLNDSIKNKSITAIAEDSKGEVWIGFQNGK